jgi:hypothetical protein
MIAQSLSAGTTRKRGPVAGLLRLVHRVEGAAGWVWGPCEVVLHIAFDDESRNAGEGLSILGGWKHVQRVQRFVSVAKRF